MANVAIIYWSGSGNTEMMAQAVKTGAEQGGSKVDLFDVDQFDVNDLKNYDGFLFGCPAMGDEELEEGSFEPFFASAESQLKDVPVGLFGSYGWGDGAWMRSWQERVQNDGAKLFGDGLIIENTPDDDGIAACEQFGREFASAL